jgi:hypothetical protein
MKTKIIKIIEIIGNINNNKNKLNHHKKIKAKIRLYRKTKIINMLIHIKILILLMDSNKVLIKIHLLRIFLYKTA